MAFDVKEPVFTRLNKNTKIYTHPKWKLYTVYNGIYYTWDKNTCTSQCRKWNSIMCTDIKLYQLGSKFI